MKCKRCLSPVSWWSALRHSARSPFCGLSTIWHWALWPVQQRATAYTPSPPFPLTAKHSFFPSLSCQRANVFFSDILWWAKTGYAVCLSLSDTHFHSFSSSYSLKWETGTAHHLFTAATASHSCRKTHDPRPLRPHGATEQSLPCNNNQKYTDDRLPFS